MAQRIGTGCNYPGGCPERAVKKGYCATHAQMAERRYDHHRGSSASRGYGYRWSTVTRPRILRRDPVCLDPFGTGCEYSSEHVDHVIPKEQGGPDDDWNLQGICRADHSKKTLLEQGVSLRKACECSRTDMCWLQQGSKTIVLVACKDHAASAALPINKWPQLVCSH